MDMSYFLKKLNMKNMSKKVYVALIFALGGVFLWTETGYSLHQTTLRVHLISKNAEGIKRLDEAENRYSDEALVLNNKELLERLPLQQKNVLTMLFIEGKNPSDIVGGLNIAQPAVSIHKRLGLKNLRDLVGKLSVHGRQNSPKHLKPRQRETAITL